MYYPWLDVPGLTAPMLVAIVALIHVFIAYYAVGGSILIALENWRAIRSDDLSYRAYWKTQLKFFLKISLLFGAVTGVGIWFTAGVVSPAAMETLIKTFVFAWAIEWCFFLLEIVSGLALYYFWDRFSPRASVFVGFVLASSAWFSLFLITGITSFMLNSSGLIRDWETTHNFWHAFLNVQLIPQTLARTGAALTLGSFYVLLHGALFEKDQRVREKLTKHMGAPAFVGLFLLCVGVVGWAFYLPESSLATLERAAATNVFVGLSVAIVVAISAVLIVGPIARPRELSVGMAASLALLGIAGVGVGEFVREAVRKPFIVDQTIYSNQIARADVQETRRIGLLYAGVWTNYVLDLLQEKEEYQSLDISSERWLGWPAEHIEYIELEPRVDDEEYDEEDLQEDDSEENESEEQQDVEDSQELTKLTNVPRVDGDFVNFIEQTAAQVQETSAQVRNVNAASRFQGVQTNGLPQSGVRNEPRASNAAATEGNLTQNDQARNNLTEPVRQENAAPQQASAQTPRQVPVQTPQQVPAQTPRQVPVQTPQQVPAQTPRQAPVQTPQQASEQASARASQNPSPQDIQAQDDFDDQEVQLTPQELDEQRFGVPAEGNLDLLKLNENDRLFLGRAVFLHHCNCCHAENKGYSAIGPMLVGRSQEELKDFALRLNYSNYYMPPWAGTQVEAELLAEFLVSIEPKYPGNVFQEPKSAEFGDEEQVSDDEDQESDDEGVEDDEIIENDEASGDDESAEDDDPFA